MDIKYRGKHKLNGEWYVGDFITEIKEFNRTCDKAFIMPHWEKLNCPIRVVKETVGQYTGLKDKHGKEIYVGDFLKVPDFYETPYYKETTYHIEEIKFEFGCFLTESGPLSEDWDYLSEESEVIGNIYDNPELLQQP